MRAFLLALALSMAVATPDATAQSRRFLAIGDSITTGYGDDNVTCPTSQFGGYPDRLRVRLAQNGLSAVVANFGVCGDTTAGALSRLDGVLATGGEAVLMMEGTNDLAHSMYIGNETIRFNLAELHWRITNAGLEAVSASVIPRDIECGSNLRPEEMAGLLAEDAAALGYVYADPYHALSFINDLYELYYSDPWHPNAAGYNLLADALVSPALEAAARLGPQPCVAGDRTLCLNGGRFKVEVRWLNFESGRGRGTAKSLSGDTGYFWFFNEQNVELMIKVLDGGANNGHFWVFFGSLSNVEYQITVTDSVTGARKVYVNPLGGYGSVGDTMAFAVAGDPPAASRAAAVPVTAAEPARRGFDAALEGAGCTPDDTTLCLNEGRFRLRASWRDFRNRTGVGQALPLTDDTGTFWFFKETNRELVIKVLDGTTSNGHYWVYYGALSNVEFDLEVVDTQTGKTVGYHNPLGMFASRGDTTAFTVP